MEHPLVSVVTPVYNTAEYLPECIESVLAQSWPNWEYVIVDNRSTDDSGKIAERHAARDPRIRVVHNERFLSQVANYNHALGQSSPAAKYVKVVQADDWIMPHCLDGMVSLAEADPEIALVGAYQLAGPNVKCQGLEPVGAAADRTVVDGPTACRKFFLEGRYLFGTPTSLLYRADVLRRRLPDFFHEGSYHEDSEVCFDILREGKFGFLHQVLTYTRVSNDSLSGRVQEFDPDAMHAFIVTRRCGRWHLSDDEFEERCRKTRDEIYQMLAVSIGRRRGKAFWDYQRRGFEIAGERLDTGRLRRMQAVRVLRRLLNPWDTVVALVDSLGPGRSR